MKGFRGWNIGELKEYIKDLPDNMPVMLMRDFEEREAKPMHYKGQISVENITKYEWQLTHETMYLNYHEPDAFSDAIINTFDALVISNA